MNIFVVASDRLVHLIPTWASQFNRHWPELAKVTVLCYQEPSSVLPSNFSVRSLGKQLGRDWTTSLIPVFTEGNSDDVVMLFLEDLFLVTPVSAPLLAECEKTFVDPIIGKVILSRIPNKMRVNATVLNKNLIVLSQTVNYRTTLKPSMWRRSYLMRYLRPGLTAWQFEVSNIPESKCDGVKVVTKKNGCVVNVFNTYDKGVFNSKLLKLRRHELTKEDSEAIIGVSGKG